MFTPPPSFSDQWKRYFNTCCCHTVSSAPPPPHPISFCWILSSSKVCILTWSWCAIIAENGLVGGWIGVTVRCFSRILIAWLVQGTKTLFLPSSFFFSFLNSSEQLICALCSRPTLRRFKAASAALWEWGGGGGGRGSRPLFLIQSLGLCKANYLQRGTAPTQSRSTRLLIFLVRACAHCRIFPGQYTGRNDPKDDDEEEWKFEERLHLVWIHIGWAVSVTSSPDHTLLSTQSLGNGSNYTALWSTNKVMTQKPRSGSVNDAYTY